MKFKILFIITIVSAIVIIGGILLWKEGKPNRIAKNGNTNKEVYKNIAAGLQFSVPSGYGLPQETIYTKTNSPDVVSGEGLEILWKENPVMPYLLFSSIDFEKFKTKAYRSTDDKKVFCPIFNSFNKEKWNYCKSATISGSEGFSEYKVETDEGSAFVTYSIYADLKNSKYSGLSISVSFPDFTEELQSSVDTNTLTDEKVQAVLEKLLKRENLNERIKKQFALFDEIIKTFSIMNYSNVSTLRSGVTNAITYETKTNGERCAVIDLNNYQPTKNTEQKTYEWIIEFPDDNCIKQKPPTNLPEQLGDAKSDTFQGTKLRRITVTYH